jgi:hypothetical protein
MHHQRPGPCPGWWGTTCLPALPAPLPPTPRPQAGTASWLARLASYIHTCYTLSLSRGQERVTDGFLACFGRPGPAPSVDRRTAEAVEALPMHSRRSGGGNSSIGHIRWVAAGPVVDPTAGGTTWPACSLRMVAGHWPPWRGADSPALAVEEMDALRVKVQHPAGRQRLLHAIQQRRALLPGPVRMADERTARDTGHRT